MSARISIQLPLSESEAADPTPRSRLPLPLAIVIALAFAIVLAQLICNTSQPLTGDAIHYIVITHSVVYDLDVELTDEYQTLFEGHLYNEPHVWIGTRGQWFPGHELGLPLLLAIPYWLGGVEGATLSLAVATILLAINMYRLAAAAAPPTFAALATIALLTTPPLFMYGLQFYPEIVAALALCIASRFAIRDRPYTATSAAFCGIATGYLPWLQMRFIPAAGVLVVIVAVAGYIPLRPKLIYIYSTVMMGCLLMAYKYVLFGSPFARALWEFGGAGILGLILDAQHGLLIYSPLYIPAFAGLIVLRQVDRRFFTVVTLTALSVFITPALWNYWWGGIGPQPARFLAALGALMAPPLAVLIRYLAKVGRVAVAMMWLVSLVAPAYFLMNSEYAYARRIIDALRPFDRFNLLGLLPDFVDNYTGVEVIYPPSRWWDSALVLGGTAFAIGAALAWEAKRQVGVPRGAGRAAGRPAGRGESSTA